METVKLAAVEDSLLEAPVYESRYRHGKNWMAVVGIDGSVRGGVTRKWAPYGKGPAVYMIGDVKVLDPIEFGADYVSANGFRTRDRWYGVVVRKTGDFLELRRCGTASEAVSLARGMGLPSQERVQYLSWLQSSLEGELRSVREELASLTDGASDG